MHTTKYIVVCIVILIVLAIIWTMRSSAVDAPSSAIEDAALATALSERDDASEALDLARNDLVVANNSLDVAHERLIQYERKLRERSTDINTLKETVMMLQDRLSAYEQMLAEARDGAPSLQTLVEYMETEQHTLETQLAAARRELRESRAEQEMMDAKVIENMRASAADANRRIAQLTQELSRAQFEQAKAERVCKLTEAQLRIEEGMNSEAQKRADELTELYAEALKTEEECEERVKELETDRIVLSARLDSERKRVVECEQKLADAENKNKKCEEEVEHYQKLVTGDLDVALHDLELRERALKQEAAANDAALTARLGEADAKLMRALEQFEICDQNNQKLDAEIDDLRRENRKLADAVNDYATDNSNLSATVQRLIENYQEVSEEKDALAVAYSKMAKKCGVVEEEELEEGEEESLYSDN